MLIIAILPRERLTFTAVRPFVTKLLLTQQTLGVLYIESVATCLNKKVAALTKWTDEAVSLDR